MLTAITIENFKGISEPVRLELRPITLLFGQNSAGKSSLLHALIYAREVFERHNLDADHTLSAGEHLDLGGFRTFVYNHDLKRSIRLRFELNLEGVDLPSIRKWDWLAGNDAALRVMFDPVSQKTLSGWVQVAISWSESLGRAYVSEYEVGLNDHLICRIQSNASATAVLLVNLNSEHPLYRHNSTAASGTAEQGTDGASLIAGLLEDVRPLLLPSTEGTMVLDGQTDALPPFTRSLKLAIHPELEDAIAIERSLPIDELQRNAIQLQERLRSRDQLASLIEVLQQTVVGPGVLVRDLLQHFRYMGPLRQLPPRDYLPPRFSEPSRWANGMAGWDLLSTQPALVDRVSRLLADSQRLNLGYTLEQVEFREFESRDRLLTALQSNSIDDIEDAEALLKKVMTRRRLLFRPIEALGVTLEPADLGVGVSQMIPVLAAALDDQPIGTATLPAQLVAVEHPELNLHPRLQAEIADVFLEGALTEATKGRIFFIETHSEVFTLRLFRRVRESHRKKSGPSPGDGRGDGSGAGYGDGSGDGRGDGSGAGDGHGGGDGSGKAPGAGHGDGSGDGGTSNRLEVNVNPSDIAVWYIDRSSGLVSVKQIRVDVEGELVESWPEADSIFEQDYREKYS